MRLALLADAFPPLRSSAAVQMRDLALEFNRLGHLVTVIVPDYELAGPWRLDDLCGVRVLRLRCPRTKDIGYGRRAIAEALMPLRMVRALRLSPLAAEAWDGVVWYSPSIFLGGVAHWLKRASKCRAYLILRDIFPEWALEMGLLREGLACSFLRAVANYQYSVADVIGIQTEGNHDYVSRWHRPPSRSVEVLRNWLAPAAIAGCSIRLDGTPLRGRTIFVYAGNMGVAQGVDILLALAAKFQDRPELGFLFVGRGSATGDLKRRAEQLKLGNVVFFDEIDPSEVPGLYAQCHVGLVSLDPRHRTHNIPGKFLSYMQAGLPVLACINAGNDLLALILDNRVGKGVTDHSIESLSSQAYALVEEMRADPQIGERCRGVARMLFSSVAAAEQIAAALRPRPQLIQGAPLV